MEYTFTVGQIIAAVAALYAVIKGVDELAKILIRWRKQAKEPEEKQNMSIEELQSTDKKIMALLDRDDKRLRVLEDGVGVLVKGQLALLGHAVDGNNEAECKEARKDINHYLISK